MSLRVPIAIALAVAAASACTVGDEEECEISPAGSVCSDPTEILAEAGEGTASFAMPSGDDVISECQEPSCIEVDFDFGAFVVEAEGPTTASDIPSTYDRVQSVGGWARVEGIHTVEHQGPTLYCVRQSAQAQVACVFAPADAPSFVFTLAAEGPNTPRFLTADGTNLLMADVTE